MPELLLELLSEEIPARMQAQAAEDLERRVTEGLKSAQLAFTASESYVTPRRLAVVVDGIPARQPDLREERRGPRVGAPDRAIQGFLKANGLTTLDQCERREAGRGEFWFAVIAQPGRPSAEVLPGLLFEALLQFPWQKSMRWGQYLARWVRPLTSILTIFDGRTLDFGNLGLGLGHLNPIAVAPIGNRTRGHRFHAPDAFEVRSFEDYRNKLLAAHVVLDAAERQRRIAEAAGALARQHGLELRADPALLAEVAGLVEWPVALMGRIDDRFMDVPSEVLTTAMRRHQKYFSLTRPDGSLAPNFIVVANIEAADGGKSIVAGNERVLRARLADAKFFWDQDRKRRLEDRVPALDGIVFHAKLGSVGQKVARLQTLAAELSEFVPGCDRDLARSAALLAKADLTTGMVGEFPELQGIMGRYYAHDEGEKPEIADAIADHYAPAGPSDRCPTRPVSVALALADRLDTLFWFFAIDERPTGSKDPFALRRAALGAIRLILENRLRLPLRTAFGLAAQANVVAMDEARRRAAIDELVAFFADRLKVHLREQGVRHDLVTAVFSVSGEDDLVRLVSRVAALAPFLRSDDGANLLTAYRRAANIVRIEERKDGKSYDGAAAEAALAQAEEIALARRLAEVGKGTGAELAREDFAAAMTTLSGLRGPVDAFFDHVTVNVDD
ncbi:MAG TPA: glycine--tRNA ligase subunit beta, partial [Alphaproteobacteria bacterium]